MARIQCFGIDFYYASAGGSVAYNIIYHSLIPSVTFYLRIIDRGVPGDFIEMAQNLKTATLKHCKFLLEKFLDHITKVALKTILEILSEPFSFPVAIQWNSILIRYKMNRPDAIVKRKSLKIIYMRAEISTDEIHLHPGQKGQDIGRLLTQLLAFFQISRH